VNPSDSEPVLVRCIDCVAQHGHDALDLLAALGGAIGGAAALIALVFAWRSARHAKASAEHAARSQELAERSANAAEEELDLFRGEVEAARLQRSRRADLRFGLSGSVASWSGARADRIRLALRWANEGSREADRVRVTLEVPETVALETTLAGQGRLGRANVSHLYSDRDAPCRYWRQVLGTIDADSQDEADVLRVRAAPREFPVALVAQHEDIPGGRLVLRWQITLPTRRDEGVDIVGPEQVLPTAPVAPADDPGE